MGNLASLPGPAVPPTDVKSDVHAAVTVRAPSVLLHGEEHAGMAVAVELDVVDPGDVVGISGEDPGEVPRGRVRLDRLAGRAEDLAVGVVNRAVAEESVVEAVVEVARGILGRGEVDRLLAVEGIAEIRAVPSLAQEQVAAILPGTAIVVREHQVRVEVYPAVDVVNPAGREAEQVVVGDVVGLERGSGLARRLEHLGGSPGERV